jgi:hypothetical protein
VRVRWLGLAAVVVAIGAGAASGTLSKPAVAAEAPAEYVEVQLNTGVTVEQLNPDGTPPTLHDQGYRHLPVPKGMTAKEYLAELRQRPDVIEAQASVRMRAATLPNDPYYSSVGANQAQYLEQIGAPAAWDLSTGSTQPIIAVVDSGSDLGHPDFEGRWWENPVDNGNDGIDRDNNGCVNDRYGCRFVTLSQVNQPVCGYTLGSSAPSNAVADDMGSSASNIGSHGTLVAGIIAAAGNNLQGVTGVAWNARIMTVKVLDCLGGGYPFDVGSGIEYAVRNGAKVINVSIEDDGPSGAASSPKLRAAVEVAQNAGVIIVAAAGNHTQPSDPVGTRYPAAYTEFPNVIAVGASDNLNGNSWASYSNYGPAVDFAAPGNRIASTVRSNLGLPNPYGYADGTSFSAPLVTGMFALMMSRNSRLTATEYIAIARAAATPVEPAPHGQNWAGSGLINIGAAVARVPMSLSGSPLRDWRDVPAGTVVEAFIDGSLCGSTQSVSFGLVGRYELRVKSNLEQPTCGQPGKNVQLVIAGAPATPTIPWGGQNEDLGLIDRDVSSVSPPPGGIVVQTLNGAWSNIAHLEPDGQLPGAVSSLPTPWNSIFKWDPLKKILDRPGAYLRFFRGVPSFASDLPVIRQYDAYWVDAPPTPMGSINPNPQTGRTIQLKAGWNNFVYTGTSREVGDALSSVGNRYKQVLQYDNGAGAWLSHLPEHAENQRYLNDFGGLFTLKVYWVLATEDVTLVMN